MTDEIEPELAPCPFVPGAKVLIVGAYNHEVTGVGVIHKVYKNGNITLLSAKRQQYAVSTDGGNRRQPLTDWRGYATGPGWHLPQIVAYDEATLLAAVERRAIRDGIHKLTQTFELFQSKMRRKNSLTLEQVKAIASKVEELNALLAAS